MRGKRRGDLSVFSVANEDARWFSSEKPSNCLGKEEEKGGGVDGNTAQGGEVSHN